MKEPNFPADDVESVLLGSRMPPASPFACKKLKLNDFVTPGTDSVGGVPHSASESNPLQLLSVCHNRKTDLRNGVIVWNVPSGVTA